MADTSGFYQVDPDAAGRLLYAPNFVHGPGFSLLRDTHDQETYPVQGWSWYDDAEAAYGAAGLPSWTDPEDDLDDLTVALLGSL